MNAKRLLSVLAIALLARCARTAELVSNSTVPPLHRADALRGAFAAQLEVTGQTLNEFMCAATLSGLPRHCDDASALLWANATAVNGAIAVAAVLQSLVADISKDVSLALESIKSIADVVGSGGKVVETVLPGAQPWAVGSASQPTYRGQMVSMSPAVHVPAYSSSDPVAAAIDADVNMLGGTASTLRDLYTKAAMPVMVAAMTGATIYMPAPSRAPDARTQPWFQGAALPSRNVIIVVDLWTADTEWGVARVAQVAQELIRTFVTSRDRACLVLSDDTDAPSPIELFFAVEDVRDKMLQRLAVRAAKKDGALFPTVRSDLQSAFHFLDSADDARLMYNLVLLVTTDAGHNNMLGELPAVTTLVIFSIQPSAQKSLAVQSVECAPRVVVVPVVAGSAPGSLSAAQLRAIAPAFSLMTASDLPKVGDVVVSCSRCSSSTDTASRLTAFMEISAVVRSKQVGEFSAASVVAAARVDLSQFVGSALERVGYCGSTCSISLVIASGINAALVLATTAVLPPEAPPAPTIFDIEGEIFKQAWPTIARAPAGSINISGVFWQDDRLGVYRGLMSDSAFQAAAADASKRAFVPRTSYREVTWASVSLSQTAFVGGVIAIFTREIEQFNTMLNSSEPKTARPPTQLDPLPIIPVCSRTFPPFVLGLCFDAPLVYNRIDLFAPAGVTYVNGSSLQVPFFSLAPVSFNSPEMFVPTDASKITFRNVQALVEAINSGSSPMPKSSTFVANGLTRAAEAELKALSLLAKMWPSRNLSRVSELISRSSHAFASISSASVFAVAVSSAVSFEFPGQISDGRRISEATQHSPAFAASLSNLNVLSLTWSAASSTIIASVPLPYPALHHSRSPPRSEKGVLAVVGVAIPAAALDSIMNHSFPALCDGVLFLCWILDEQGRVLHARDLHCSRSAVSCVGISVSTVRPLIASRLVSSGIFQMHAVDGSSSVMYSMFRNRSISTKTIGIAASHDGTTAPSEQRLEVNVFPLAGTSATVVVLSGEGMQPVIDANRSGFLDGCGPMGIICTSAEPKDGHHPSRFSVSATFQMTPKPVLLTPFHSAACDLSTPPWAWAVLGTCLFLFFASLCGGPVLIRMYRKRKTARLMFESLELKTSSTPQKAQELRQQPRTKVPAAPESWTPVSSVDSFCNTSYLAEEAVLAMHRRGAGKLVELEDEVVVTEQQLTFLENRIENFVMRLSGIELLVQHWDAINDQSQRAMTSLPNTFDHAKSHKD